ncbi:hypothetical protein GONAM_16_00250 [Gordonia namibiensis NBRC 108229]|uniref:Uncharacterized protein n=1 Tax=Gordonia namibiensis NBRC 108229 TaxID=1208314 RepID=K6WM98_9ACTN|nr:hypothetical protein [Gordonia namibiensis]GAC00526.1 hypothetical protein GONAM_16_00250 [Gordonia namibiensis NBRC 108229]
MTKKHPGTRTKPPRPLDTAQQTLDAFDRLLADAAEHGITPTKAVADTRQAIADVVLAEQQTDAEIANLAHHLDGTADDALAILSREDTSPQQRSEAAARVIAGATPQTARQLTKMRNQNRFRRAREAHNTWLRLGDTLITDTLRPWTQAIIVELTSEPHTLADHIVAGRWQGLVEAEEFRQEYSLTAADIRRWDTMPQRHHVPYKRLRAVQLVAEFEHVTNVVDELRQRGLLPDLDPAETNTTTAALYFEHPDKLPDTTTAGTRTTLWICDAIANGAAPTIRTATEAVAAHKEPAMATT